MTRLTVDGVAALSQGESADTVLLSVWWTLTLLIDVLLSSVGQAVRGNVAERFTAHINMALIRKSETLPGLELLGDGRFYDDLEVLQKNAAFRPLNVLVTLVYTGRDLLALTGVALLLVSVGPWVPVAAALSAYPLVRTTLKFRELSWGVTLNRTPKARAMAYETSVALTHTYSRRGAALQPASVAARTLRTGVQHLGTERRGVFAASSCWRCCRAVC